MKDITRLMVLMYKLDLLGIDFMGYEKEGNGELSYHHLIIPKRKGGIETIQNGAIIRRIPHDYLHIIERYDPEIFRYLTSEMIDMNVKGYIDMENIENIDDLLYNFENDHARTRTKKGKPIIKDKYLRRKLRP